MYKRVKLSNFRQHRDREIFFTPGINAVRGANEAGKSAMLEAVAYCQFGAVVGLREPLEKVVTWGEKVSTLKTEVDCEVNGVIYCGKRSKSGAEVWLQGGVAPLVTGQSECTKFWESVLGVSAKVAGSMMLAKQSSLRGALEGGAAAPVLLIETLANFKLIDTVINLVKEKIPNGHSGVIVQRIESIKAQLDTPLVDETTELRKSFELQAALVDAASHDLSVAQQACDAHGPKAKAAQDAVNALERAQQAVAASRRTYESAQTAAKIEVPPAPDVSGLAALRGQASDAGQFQRAVGCRQRLDALKAPEAEWDEGMPALQVEIAAKKKLVIDTTARRTELQVKLAQAEGRIIKETQCAFCDKDLADVPEVTTRNNTLANEVEALRGDIKDLTEIIQAATGDWADLEGVVKDAHHRQTIYQTCGEFIVLDTAFVPARFTWNGPDTSKVPADPSSEILRLEQAQKAHQQAQGRLQEATAALARAQTTYSEAQAALIVAEAAEAAGKPDREKAVDLAGRFAQADAQLRMVQQTHQAALAALQTSEAVHRERVAARGRLQADLLAEEQNLKDLGRGNALLDKLRTARPQIADKLWKVVLASVSTYFSSIRGTKSVVTRSDNGFQVDGKDIDGLSGSALDALGLAIRIALTKTFLPNARFMVLDEASAACDDTREGNMISCMITSDFDQVVWVTHSGAVEVFAETVIQL